ncbi:calcium-dependent phosphotriesterase [Neoconidiobolus thromboides FSU 785]|nr:calcium-dependent phosphotriesterase [Neoconidiobolus thromboides FSU 785]
MSIISYTLVVLLAILAYFSSGFINLLFFSESFLNEFKQSDLSKCHTLPELKGCEDLAIHYLSNQAIIGCPGNYLLHKENVKLGYSPRDKLTRNKESFIYSYDFNKQQVKKLTINNLPTDINLSFQGLDIIEDPKDKELVHILVINHRFNNIDSVEHFSYKVNENSVDYIESFLNKEFNNLNGITAVSPTSFYVTKDISTSSGFIHYLEQLTFLAYGSVLYKNEVNEVVTVAKGYKYPNGLAINYQQDLVYMTETMNGKLHLFNRDKDTGELEEKEVIELSFLPDNIKLEPVTGNLYLAGFPKSLGVFKYFETYNTNDYKPVEGVVARISNETGDGKFYGKNYKQEILLMDKLGPLSTTSVAAANLKLNRILISGLLNPEGILDCPIDLSQN